MIKSPSGKKNSRFACLQSAALSSDAAGEGAGILQQQGGGEIRDTSVENDKAPGPEGGRRKRVLVPAHVSNKKKKKTSGLYRLRLPTRARQCGSVQPFTWSTGRARNSLWKWSVEVCRAVVVSRVVFGAGGCEILGQNDAGSRTSSEKCRGARLLDSQEGCHGDVCLPLDSGKGNLVDFWFQTTCAMHAASMRDCMQCGGFQCEMVVGTRPGK